MKFPVRDASDTESSVSGHQLKLQINGKFRDSILLIILYRSVQFRSLYVTHYTQYLVLVYLPTSLLFLYKFGGVRGIDRGWNRSRRRLFRSRSAVSGSEHHCPGTAPDSRIQYTDPSARHQPTGLTKITPSVLPGLSRSQGLPPTPARPEFSLTGGPDKQRGLGLFET